MTALNLRPTYITKHRVFSLVILCQACTTDHLQLLFVLVASFPPQFPV
uniref:Uncharacterized protein n=1 Tax=Anguilla anguilla TaxID=7936 RepID=A0A0E9RNH3_ANGAN